LEAILQTLQPIYIGEDHQIDTYFNVKQGRLKLREGNIENALIWYLRPNDASAKLSQVLLYKHDPDIALKEILCKVHEIKVIVNKKRSIYFIDNVKFHFDEVQFLGNFIEVEAIDHNGSLGLEKIQAQCDHYASLFNILPSDYIATSYSDLLLNLQHTNS
ncbi:MAG: class IV adenylate cyclase, partial [Ferruginibacter sp.]